MFVREQLIQALPGVTEGAELAKYTSWKVGGPADFLYKAESPESLVQAVETARKIGMPYFILAGGHNVLISDDGFEGLVILNRVRGYKFDGDLARVNSGENLAFLVLMAKKDGLGGLEEMVGIPGTVGGAIFGNAGSFGKETKDVLQQAEVYDTKGLKTYKVNEINYGFRNSYFKSNPELTILSGSIKFVRKTLDAIEKEITEFQAQRHDRQPLMKLSCGSVFINPLPDSAGRYIDECGLKGTRVGGAVVSEKHANFIVNEGGATASDIKKLIDKVQLAVLDKYDVKLVPEVRIIGRW